MRLIVTLLMCVWARVTTSCDNMEEVDCPKYSKCKQDGDESLLCCDVDNLNQLTSIIRRNADVRHLHIKNMTVKSLNANLPFWNSLASLTISSSNVAKIEGTFAGQLRCVNFSGINIYDIDSKAFLSLPNLHTIDISKNNITDIPKIVLSDSTENPRNITLDISENYRIGCQRVRHLMIGFENSSNLLQLANENSSFCLTSHSFTWFNSTSIVPITQVVMQKKLELICPRGATFKCHCSPYRVDILPGQFPTYNVQVDCSGQHLTELPRNLPPNTKFLNVTNNNITSLEILSVEESYRNVREFYADNNQINSICKLEDSYFIYNFARLSLRWNNLTEIPTYVLSNAFERNKREPKVNLGGNKMICDCSTIQQLKMWLIANKAYVPDYEEVLCAEYMEKVIFFNQNKVCVSEKKLTDYIYYIIGGEVLLLVLLITKVSYDSWVFKTTGNLPWPASKLPKLPCDWVFEL